MSKIHNTCLTNHTGSIAHHIKPLVINALRGWDTHTHAHAHTHTRIVTNMQTKQFQETRHTGLWT